MTTPSHQLRRSRLTMDGLSVSPCSNREDPVATGNSVCSLRRRFDPGESSDGFSIPTVARAAHLLLPPGPWTHRPTWHAVILSDLLPQFQGERGLLRGARPSFARRVIASVSKICGGLAKVGPPDCDRGCQIHGRAMQEARPMPICFALCGTRWRGAVTGSSQCGHIPDKKRCCESGPNSSERRAPVNDMRTCPRPWCEPAARLYHLRMDVTRSGLERLIR
jgi:hypothetical protein